MSAAAGHAELSPALRVPGIPLARLVRVELRKMADTRAGFWLLVTVVLITVAVAIINEIGASAQNLTFTDTFRTLQWPVSILLPVLGILSVTSEWSQRTALTTFTLVPHRGRVILAKSIAILLLGIAAIAASFVVAAIANLVTSGDGSWSFSAATFGEALAFQLTGLFGGLAFGLMLQSSAPAIVLYYIVPTAISIVIELIGSIRDAANWFNIGNATIPLGEGGASGKEWAQLGTSALIWIGIPLAIGLYRLSRSELK
jgi:ABC-type transport system involved in multi-copper enzyme maturation permease subunit